MFLCRPKNCSPPTLIVLLQLFFFLVKARLNGGSIRLSETQRYPLFRTKNTQKQHTMKRAAVLSGARRCLHAEVSGAEHKAQLNNTIGYYFSAQARRVGHRNGFRVPHQGVNWTYIDMKKNSDAFAQGMFNSGLKPGDRVLSIQPSTAEAFMTQAACARIGVVCVHFNPYSATADSIADAIDKYQPTHIVIREFCEMPDGAAGGKKKKKGASSRKSIYEMLYQSIPELDQVIGNISVRAPRYPSVKEVIVTDNNMNLPGATTMRNKVVWGPFNYYESITRRVSTFMTPDQPASIVPGPDGRDVVYTHRNIMTAAFHTAQFLGLKNESRVMLAPQTSHRPLFLLAHYASLAAGSSISYGAEHLHDDAVCQKSCQKKRQTY